MVQRFTGNFPDHKAAEYYALANTGTKDSPEEVDWFDIYENDNPVARLTFDLRAAKRAKFDIVTEP